MGLGCVNNKESSAFLRTKADFTLTTVNNSV
jgi:hypothetical protein